MTATPAVHAIADVQKNVGWDCCGQSSERLILEHMFDLGMREFEALAEAIDAVVDVDPTGLTDGQVHRQLMELLRQQAKLDSATARLAASWDARRAWAEDGSKSPDARLAREAKLRRATTSRIIKRARALATMPLTAAALAEGAITTDHVDVLMHANAQSRVRCTRFAIDEHTLVAYCRQLTFFEADRAIRNWINVVDAALDDDGPEPTWRDREAAWFRGIEGDVHVRAILPPVGGSEFIAAVERIERELYLDDQRTGSERTGPQRRADALVEMARRAMAMPADANKPRPVITVIMGDWSFRHLCELTDGTIVSPQDLLPHLSEADVEGVLFDGPFHGVGVSSQRTFNGVLRKIIQIRDRHCQHESGCDAPISQCDVDHIVPWSAGGVTEQENGRLMCRPQNRNSDLHARGPTNITVFDDDPITILIRQRAAGLRRTPSPAGDDRPAAAAAHSASSN